MPPVEHYRQLELAAVAVAAVETREVVIAANAGVKTSETAV